MSFIGSFVWSHSYIHTIYWDFMFEQCTTTALAIEFNSTRLDLVKVELNHIVQESSGRGSRTPDLKVMSLASYHLLYPAICLIRKMEK